MREGICGESSFLLGVRTSGTKATPLTTRAAIIFLSECSTPGLRTCRSLDMSWSRMANCLRFGIQGLYHRTVMAKATSFRF
jgi:hypothetical protein